MFVCDCIHGDRLAMTLIGRVCHTLDPLWYPLDKGKGWEWERQHCEECSSTVRWCVCLGGGGGGGSTRGKGGSGRDNTARSAPVLYAGVCVWGGGGGGGLQGERVGVGETTLRGVLQYCTLVCVFGGGGGGGGSTRGKGGSGRDNTARSAPVLYAGVCVWGGGGGSVLLLPKP